MKKIDFTKCVKYCAYFVAFTFLHYLESQTGVRAFAVAFFFGLVYNRNNVLLLAPLYIGSAVICEFCWQSCVMASVPVAISAIILFVHYKLRKKLTVTAVTAYAVISTLPRIAFMLTSVRSVVMFCLSALLVVPATYVFVSVEYLVLVKKFAFKVTPKEFIALLVSFVLVGVGLADVAVEGVKAYYCVLTFTVSMAVFASRKAGITVALAMGLGGAIRGDVDMLALSALYGGFTVCFNPNYGYFGGVIALVINVLGVVFGYLDQSYYALISPAVGVLFAILVPTAVKRKVSTFAYRASDGLTRSVINKNRALTALKVECLGSALKEMSAEIASEVKIPTVDPKAVAASVAERCCRSCPSCESCRNALGGNSTEVVLTELAESATATGRASILDASPFLSSRCRRLNGIISVTNDVIGNLKSKAEAFVCFDEDKKLLREQVEGLAGVLETVSSEIGAPLRYDNSTEGMIREAFNARGVAVTDVCVTDERVGFTVGEADSDKPKIKEVVSEVMCKPMSMVSKIPTVNGKVDVFFEPSPKYRVAYGERVVSAGDDGCGDKEKVVKLGLHKVMVILSDGMGHGRDADRNSSRAVSLISGFYKAGLDHNTVLKSVSRLMKLGGKEQFNAVDIAVIDTSTGDVDLIKQGARESYILTDGEVEVIECGSLPLGIVDEVVPFTSTFRLTSESFLVLASDGVADVIGTSGMVELLSSLHTRNPDDVSAAVMDNVVRLSGDNGEVKDDASVITVRLF